MTHKYEIPVTSVILPTEIQLDYWVVAVRKGDINEVSSAKKMRWLSRRSVKWHVTGCSLIPRNDFLVKNFEDTEEDLRARR